ncbi:5-oxoprolinase subunit PxpA [Microbulbifer pacificus]|uniref:5-oxoprolinase subunit PxpA n=1 Tax=Microbulbifer pacificus TaxID=407164 RepID=UPI000CF4F533|nr:5-oxoprolinase subunit PxpA [Microbulbifer pacificus]
MNTPHIDINCDLGEGKSVADCERDATMMPFISRCNIACGGHAGNNTTMRLSVGHAKRNRLAIGAHPGYPDRENFGRISLAMERTALLASIREQIRALAGIAAEQQIELTHIKLHGALYNDAEADTQLAEDLVALIVREFPSLQILGLANAAMERAAQKFRQPFLREGFMDRRYLNDHQLSPRTQPGALIDDFDQCLDQVMALIHGSPFRSIDDELLLFHVDSICLHGDTPGAHSIARNLHQHLQLSGIQIRA